MPGLDALTAGAGQTDQRDARHAIGGLLALAGPTALDHRTGVLAGPGSTALITGTSKTGPTMSVRIGAHVAATTRGAANGPYLGPTLEAPIEVDVELAPQSGSRIDVVYVKQRDTTSGIPTPDTTSGPLYAVLTGTVSTGTPSKPDLSQVVGAEELGTVRVDAGATSTSGTGVTVTNTVRQTVARGATIPVRNQAERDAITGHNGQPVWRQDTRTLEVLSGAAGVLAAVLGSARIVSTPGSGLGTTLTQGGKFGMHPQVVISRPFGAGVPFQGLLVAVAYVSVAANSEVALGVAGDPDAAVKSVRHHNNTGSAHTDSVTVLDTFDTGTADSYSFQPIFKAQVGSVTPINDGRLCYSIAVAVPKAL